MQQLIAQICQTEHGFKHIVEAGDRLLSDPSSDHLAMARNLLSEAPYQARMLGTYLLGELSATEPEALQLLTTSVVNDDNWRVQEMLAKALDAYCRNTGYEAALPNIRHWLKDDRPNLKRAVIEGLRIWTGRPYFQTHPEVAIALIAEHRANESEYLRKSVGNALRDIRRKFPELVQKELSSWDLADKHVAFVQRLVMK